MSSNRYDLEQNYLNIVKEMIDVEIESLKQEIIEIPKKYRHRYSDTAGGDEDLISHLVEMNQKRIEKLDRMRENSYFGRFDYTDDLINICERFYIGKASITDREGKIFTLDWRAPICSLYYDQDMGRVKYDSIDGSHSGILNLKSQIFISNGKIDNIVDTNSIKNDELILPFLKNSVGSKMKDIVASIQSEQNAIIRYPFSKNVIVQGVAGSGKTSVALHRVAYLLYDQKKYKSDQFLVIGPNKCFNDYISNVLPDLDSEGIGQIIFDDLLFQNLKEKIKQVKKESNEQIACYKNSLNYKNNLENFLKDYINDINLEIVLENEIIVSKQKIKSLLLSTSGCLKDRLDIVMKKVVEIIKGNKETIENQIWEKFRNEMIVTPTEETKHRIYRQKTEIREQLKKGCRDLVKKEFSKYNIKTLDLYKKFIENFDIYCYKLSNKEIRELQQTTLVNLERQIITDSDIPALLYINLMIKNNGNSNDIVHVVVDEAQDYGLFHFYLLPMMFPNSTFSIFGDLAQSIYGYKSINDWNELKDNIFTRNTEILNLNQSYRTTKEITLEANKILGSINLTIANPVLRTGAPVQYKKNGDVLEEIKRLIDKDYTSIAVICKDEGETLEKYKEITSIIRNVKLVRTNDATYNGGLCVIDVNSSKGLEFDAVVINDASSNRYNNQSLTDSKKLYVAMTRALHELVVCYQEPIVESLEESVKVKIRN